jgi:putative Mg2+ transporter-C (MgtC) family protein
MPFFDTIFGSFHLAVLLKLLLAALGGGIIGLEREKHGRPAGLRTHLLVALGACLMMIISEAFAIKYAAADADSALRLDPARTAAQIISGIGFLGAGVILKEGISIRGLTTAASLWMAAGLGMAFGMGLFAPAVMGTAIALCSLIFLKKLEPIIKKDRFLFLTVIAQRREGLFEEMEQLFEQNHLRIADIESDLDLENNQVRYEFIITQHHRRIGRNLTDQIMAIDSVKRIKFK